MDALFVAAGLNPKGTKRRDRITLHSLRHTFASGLAIAGLPLRRIQELLGHKSIVTTDRYSHLGDNGMRPSYGELARAAASGFVNPGATPVSGTQRLRAAEVPETAAKNFIINSVFTRREGAAWSGPQVLETLGGGGATRTLDLGIMRLLGCVLKNCEEACNS
jgi:hypothetical protein